MQLVCIKWSWESLCCAIRVGDSCHAVYISSDIVVGRRLPELPKKALRLKFRSLIHKNNVYTECAYPLELWIYVIPKSYITIGLSLLRWTKLLTWIATCPLMSNWWTKLVFYSIRTHIGTFTKKRKKKTPLISLTSPCNRHVGVFLLKI